MASRYVAKIRPGVGGVPKGTIPWNKGKRRHVTWGRAISAATKGKPKSAEWKAKMSEIMLGHRLSQETKDKISASTQGRSSWCKGFRKATHPQKMSSIGRIGKLHWAWKGGISSEACRSRQSSEYKVWRDSVFRRDNWTCQHCGKRGGYLEAHHKQSFAAYPDLRLAVENGETLCLPCHKQEKTL